MYVWLSVCLQSPLPLPFPILASWHKHQMHTLTHTHTLELHAKFQQVGKFAVGGEKSSRIATFVI